MEWGVHKTPPSQRLGTAEHKSSTQQQCLPGEQEFRQDRSAAQLKEHGDQHISQALLEDLCWSLPCVHSVPGQQPKCLTMPYNPSARSLFLCPCKVEQCSIPTQRCLVGEIISGFHICPCAARQRDPRGSTSLHFSHGTDTGYNISVQ